MISKNHFLFSVGVKQNNERESTRQNETNRLPFSESATLIFHRVAFRVFSPESQRSDLLVFTATDISCEYIKYWCHINRVNMCVDINIVSSKYECVICVFHPIYLFYLRVCVCN